MSERATQNLEFTRKKLVHAKNFMQAKDLQQLLGYTKSKKYSNFILAFVYTNALNNKFENLVHLVYVEWRKFLGVIEKAKEACTKSNNNITDHFVGAAKTIAMPKSFSNPKINISFITTNQKCLL